MSSERGQSVKCPHCGFENPADAAHAGEIRRGKTCRECGETFEVDLDELQREA